MALAALAFLSRRIAIREGGPFRLREMITIMISFGFNSSLPSQWFQFFRS
jgi:hypothetical protein